MARLIALAGPLQNVGTRRQNAGWLGRHLQTHTSGNAFACAPSGSRTVVTSTERSRSGDLGAEGATTSGRDTIALGSGETSSSMLKQAWVAGGSTLALCCVCLAVPSSVHAAESAPPGFLELIIDTVESLGPFGPLAFVLAVALCETIPLFPTQPFGLASGLLFGTFKGAALVWFGTMASGLAAFLLARGQLRPLAERLIQFEMKEAGINPDGPVQRALASVEEAIEHGSFKKLSLAILVLRLTPVIPYSASNYLLGLTLPQLPLAPLLAGSAVGMAWWSLLYASLGGASRGLLARGVSPEVLMGDLLDRAKLYSGEVAIAGGVVAAGAAVFYGANLAQQRLQDTLVSASHRPEGQPQAADQLSAGQRSHKKERELEPTVKE